ncbi:hypothetical protein CLV77_0651 [Brevirhabdus pacifica]|nr:hypothetical protein CLV77_0651 [Brevirhabdus pacifica]
MQDRVDLASAVVAAEGLTRELAMFVLSDTQYLRLDRLGAESWEENFINIRKKMFQQAVAGKGFFVALAMGRTPFAEAQFDSIPQYLSDLLARTRSDKKYYHGALKACEEILLHNPKEMHPLLARWLAGVLSGSVTPPRKRKGPDPKKNEARNSQIALAVEILVDIGYSPTRNAVSKPTSACDYVAEAIGSLGGVNLGYDAVAKIYAAEARGDEGE